MGYYAGPRHQPITLPEIADPLALGDAGRVYTKEIAAITELFYREDLSAGGSIVQITSNGSVNIPAGSVTGTGTTNQLSKYTNGAEAIIGDSQIFDNGTFIGIGVAEQSGSEFVRISQALNSGEVEVLLENTSGVDDSTASYEVRTSGGTSGTIRGGRLVAIGGISGAVINSLMLHAGSPGNSATNLVLRTTGAGADFYIQPNAVTEFFITAGGTFVLGGGVAALGSTFKYSFLDTSGPARIGVRASGTGTDVFAGFTRFTTLAKSCTDNLFAGNYVTAFLQDKWVFQAADSLNGYIFSCLSGANQLFDWLIGGNTAANRKMALTNEGVLVIGAAGAASGSELLRVQGLARIDGAAILLDLVQSATTSGSPTALTFTGAAHTTLAAGVEATDVNFNLARTVEFATGALATQRAFRIQGPTYGFVAASTITTATTLEVAPPVVGANATITNLFAALFTGAVEILGNVGIQNGVGNSPQYRLDVGDASYFAINGSFAHIVQHNSAASTFWSIAPRNGGDLDIAVTTTDPRPTGATIGTTDNILSLKTDKTMELVMGDSTGFSVMGGVADSQFADVGNVGAGEDTLHTFTLPADALNADGKAIRIKAIFRTAANANVKTIKLHFGGTVVGQSGAAAINNRIIYFDAIVVRTGASVQRATTFRVEGTDGGFSDNTLLDRTAPAEDTTAAIVIKGTGEGVANNDVVQESMLVEFLN